VSDPTKVLRINPILSAGAAAQNVIMFRISAAFCAVQPFGMLPSHLLSIENADKRQTFSQARSPLFPVESY
jgi:hypothetical protein